MHIELPIKFNLSRIHTQFNLEMKNQQQKLEQILFTSDKAHNKPFFGRIFERRANFAPRL